MMSKRAEERRAERKEDVSKIDWLLPINIHGW
jgi:hypothetical protein